MRRAFSRLRWQLTVSHLVAIAFTLVSMVAAVILIGTTWFASQVGSSRAPTQDARLVAQAVGGLVARGDVSTLNGVLRALADGSLRMVAPNGPPSGRRPDAFDFSLRDVAYIAVVGLDGQLLASSDPAAAGEWQALLSQAIREEAPAGLGTAPILDDQGRAVATVVLARSVLPDSASALDFWHALLIFGAASIAVLSAAFVFALASSTVVAYLLSRRLVARLERLGGAAEALRSGNLAARVAVGGGDEVTQLQVAFNSMAADLERTLRELEAERDRVAGLLEARRQLVAGVSHELRTPVATMRASVEASLQRHQAVSVAGLETMERELVRLQRLIDDLFTLSRAEVGHLELRVGPTDVGAVVRRQVDAQAPLAWQRQRVQVLIEAEAISVPRACADPERLEQIVSNLLGNAIRHTPPGGLVAAAVVAEPDAVRLEVRDTGAGIAPEDLPHIFERFYRGRNEDGAGVGLGLTLVKELAEAMGGSVHVASAPGEGSCFSVRLPVAVSLTGSA